MTFEHFPSADEFVADAVAIAFPAFVFPIRLGDACVAGFVRFADPRFGASASYASAAGAMTTVYAHDGGVEGVPDGADSSAVEAQLAQASAELRARGEADGVVQKGRSSVDRDHRRGEWSRDALGAVHDWRGARRREHARVGDRTQRMFEIRSMRPGHVATDGAD